MPFPLFPDKLRGTPLLTAADVIAYQQARGHLKEPPQLDAAIVCLKRGLPERLKRKHPFRRAGHYLGDLYVLKNPKRKIAVMANFGFGAPVVAALVEELAALGANRIVSLSLAGSLQPGLKSGDIVVCSEALRDEGTSYHYLPAEQGVMGNPDLLRQLVAELKSGGTQVTEGVAWSTDAPFRETREEVTHFRQQGVSVVEMETAALYAVSQVAGIQAASILVAGDDLSGGKWLPPGDTWVIEEAFERVYAGAISVLDQ